MTNWQHKVKVKHLFTENEDCDSIRQSMMAIADVLDGDTWFARFQWLPKFRSIPEGDVIMRPLDYANRLLDHLYDYADFNRIWIA